MSVRRKSRDASSIGTIRAVSLRQTFLMLLTGINFTDHTDGIFDDIRALVENRSSRSELKFSTPGIFEPNKCYAGGNPCDPNSPEDTICIFKLRRGFWRSGSIRGSFQVE